jgi:hypothetical protein
MNDAEKKEFKKAQSKGYFLEPVILYNHFTEPEAAHFSKAPLPRPVFVCLSLSMLKKFIARWKQDKPNFTKWDEYIDFLKKHPNPPIDMRYLRFGSEHQKQFEQSLDYLVELKNDTCICGMEDCLKQDGHYQNRLRGAAKD